MKPFALDNSFQTAISFIAFYNTNTNINYQHFPPSLSGPFSNKKVKIFVFVSNLQNMSQAHKYFQALLLVLFKINSMMIFFYTIHRKSKSKFGSWKLLWRLLNVLSNWRIDSLRMPLGKRSLSANTLNEANWEKRQEQKSSQERKKLYWNWRKKSREKRRKVWELEVRKKKQKVGVFLSEKKREAHTQKTHVQNQWSVIELLVSPNLNASISWSRCFKFFFLCYFRSLI